MVHIRSFPMGHPELVRIQAQPEEPREIVISVRSSFGNLNIDMAARVRTPSPERSEDIVQESQIPSATHGLDDPDRYISESD